MILIIIQYDEHHKQQKKCLLILNSIYDTIITIPTEISFLLDSKV